MSETIHEQIAQWIAAALDGQQDPDKTLTLRAVRPKVLDWTEEDFQNGDVVIEAASVKTQSTTMKDSRMELGTWICSGIIRELPDETTADTVLSRMIETIRRVLWAGNTLATACDGLAVDIDCTEANFEIMAGGLIAQVTVEVIYRTALLDGFTQA